MLDNPKWIPNAESECIRNWTESLHTKAKQLLVQDGMHASLLFLFKKEHRFISANLVPPNIDHDQLNIVVRNTINENNLYGVILISEAWMYLMKENDHATFQLLDGEMKVSDLNSEDKREALIVRMENSDGDCLVYSDEIVRNKNSVILKDGLITRNSPKKWFVQTAKHYPASESRLLKD